MTQSPSPARDAAAVIPAGPKGVRDYARRHWGRLQPLGPAQKLAYLYARLAARVSKTLLGQQFKRIVCAWYLRTGRRVPPSLRRFYFIEAGRRAARAYVPRVYPGSALLVVTEENSRDQQRAWAALLAGGIKTYVIKTDHFGILDERHADAMAEWLKAYLHAAQPAAGQAVADKVAVGS